MSGNEAADRQACAERAAAALFEADRASRSLGMRITAIAPYQCTVTMTVRADMLNGQANCHGGVIFALADSAFAFACNSDGVPTVSASSSIDYLVAAKEGDELTATARQLWEGGRSALYEVTVANQHGTRVALFRGRSHRRAPRNQSQQESK